MFPVSPFLTFSSEFESQMDVLESNSSLIAGSATQDQSLRLPPTDELHLVTAVDVIEQLFYMHLVSLRGFQELSQMECPIPFRIFSDVMVRQRTAQCAALARLSPNTIRFPLNSNPVEESLADPSAFELRTVWLRAIRSFEKEEFARFGDHVELAESMLEDSCLNAANTFRNSGVSVLFLEHAMNVFGARQRFEELTGDLTGAC